MKILPSRLPPTFPARPINGGALTSSSPRPGWRYEPKYNGWRALVNAPAGTMFNRHGQRLSIEGTFHAALARLRHLPYWLDCEALDRRHGLGRGALIILDVLLPALPGRDPPDYKERRSLLGDIFPVLQISKVPEPNSLHVPPSFSCAEVFPSYQTLQSINREWNAPFYEGVVGKKVASIYPLQLRSANQEFPFWQKHRWRF